MPATNTRRENSDEDLPANQQDRLQTLLKDLEGVERLQQMQWRLLKEVIQEVNRLKLA